MKKSLFYIALAGVASTTAQAQSSVTLGGTADAAFTRGTGSLVDRSGVSSGGNSTSKFYLRGTEDLGGGLSALFWLEAGILLDTGMGQPTNPNNAAAGGPTAPPTAPFNRRSIVGLKGNWGEVHLGRDWAPMYDAYTSKFDPFGVGVGIAMNYAASPTQANGAVRVSNAAGYTSPRFAGLSANVQKWFGENPGNTPTENDGKGQGIRLNYDAGPIGAAAHWGRTNYAAGDAVYRALAVVYDFGMVRASVIYNNDRQGTVDSKGWLLGGVMQVGVGEIKASYSTIHADSTGVPKATKLAAGYVYNLSKRTALYTTLAHVRNSGGSRQALGGATTAVNQSSNGLDIGMRHNF